MKKSKAKKLAKLLGWEYGEIGDGSCCYVTTQNNTHCVEITFDPTGNILTDVAIYKRIFEEMPSEQVAAIDFEGDEHEGEPVREYKCLHGGSVAYYKGYSPYVG